MAKWASRNVMDKGLEYLRDHADLLVACQGQPVDYAEATEGAPAGKWLGQTALGPLHFQLRDGLVSGRRLTVSGRPNLLCVQAGTADHFALVDTASAELLYVTEALNPQQTYGQNLIATPDWDITIDTPL